MKHILLLTGFLISFSSSFCFAAEEALLNNRIEESISLSTSLVQPEDLLATKLATGVFHLYAQWNQGDPSLDMSKRLHRDRSIMGYSFSYDYPAIKEFSDWKFKAIEGHLGFYLPYAITGYVNKEFFGVVGFHPSSNTIAVIFRGSQVLGEYLYNNFNTAVKLPLSQREGKSLRDWSFVEGYHDLSFDGPFHAGYYNRLMTCQDALLTQIQYFLDQAQPNPRLIITGHSLGSASSCMLAGLVVSDEVSTQGLRMSQNKFWKLKNSFSEILLRPVGAPRISDHKYGPWLKERGVNIKHIVCQTDIIPLVPTHQIVGANPFEEWRTYADIDERFELDSYGIETYQIISAHDIRLYWYSIAQRAGIDPASFPLFKLSNDTDYMRNLLGLEPIVQTSFLSTLYDYWNGYCGVFI